MDTEDKEEDKESTPTSSSSLKKAILDLILDQTDESHEKITTLNSIQVDAISTLRSIQENLSSIPMKSEVREIASETKVLLDDAIILMETCTRKIDNIKNSLNELEEKKTTKDDNSSSNL